MEIFQLRCFVAVATELSFSKAATRLNMTQPPLSRQIKQLEHQVGVPLLTRSTRSVQLTPAGQAFLPEAKAILNRTELAKSKAARIASGDMGELSLAFVSGAVYAYVPKVLMAAAEDKPHVSITLHEMTSAEQHDAVLEGTVDLGIVRSLPPHTELSSKCLLEEPFLLALPKGHGLLDRPSLCLSDLAGQRMMTYSQSQAHGFYEMLVGAFNGLSEPPEIIHKLGSTAALLSLVNAGLGMALLPQSAKTMGFSEVCFRNIDLPTHVVSRLYLVWREESPNPLLPWLIEQWQGVVEQPMPSE